MQRIANEENNCGHNVKADAIESMVDSVSRDQVE